LIIYDIPKTCSSQFHQQTGWRAQVRFTSSKHGKLVIDENGTDTQDLESPENEFQK